MSNRYSLFNKVLIANRGEIAVRVVRACRDLGIVSAVLFSASDRGSLAVRLADEAYEVEGLDGRDAYLNVERVVALARQVEADALHPGYGFLSERADLAEQCAAVGIVFIGPTPDNIRNLGDKNQARNRMAQAGVPIVPGTREPLASASEAVERAAALGYPVLIKAAHGGGGRGMRLVRAAADMAVSFEAATHEAKASFGQGDVYLEKYFDHPRHIEVQVAADHRGQVRVFPERECSIQRRFQKMVEESPSSVLTASVRERLMEAARRGASAVDYRNVGTFEFLVDSEQNFYFLEVNTRLQVEHPVTEAVTGVDLVSLQIRLAAGLDMPMEQSDLGLNGWAFEARITCEDPFANFAPGPGRIDTFVLPQGPGVRVDTGFDSGSVIPRHYDSLMAKLIVHGADREEARRRMLRALSECVVVGVPTTVPFHLALFAHPDFIAGNISTHFLAEQALPLPVPSDYERKVASALAALWDVEHVTPPSEAPSRWQQEARTHAVSRLS